MAVIARDGTILDANRAASALFAWPHAEFLGRNIPGVYANPEDRARYQKQIERDGYVRDFEVVFVTRDGRRLDCLLTTVVRRAVDGSVSGYQGIVRDVSERKRMEKELREYHEQVRSRTVKALAAHPELSPREREVVRLISEDLTTPKIARQLNLSENTVHTYRKRIMHKLDRHGVAALTKYAVSTGPTTL